MGIRITNNKSKMPRALKLMSAIVSYLFEEEHGECEYMKDSEKAALKKAANALGKASDRTVKK